MRREEHRTRERRAGVGVEEGNRSSEYMTYIKLERGSIKTIKEHHHFSEQANLPDMVNIKTHADTHITGKTKQMK